MNGQVATVIQDPHELFRGANGVATYGITVQSNHSEAECRKRGLQHKWFINDYVFRTTDPSVMCERLGITPERHTELAQQFAQLQSA